MSLEKMFSGKTQSDDDLKSGDLLARVYQSDSAVDGITRPIHRNPYGILFDVARVPQGQFASAAFYGLGVPKLWKRRK